MSKKYFIFYIIFFIQLTFGSTCFQSTLINQNIKYKIGIGLISINLIGSTVGFIRCTNESCKNSTLRNRFFNHFFHFISYSEKEGYRYRKYSTTRILVSSLFCSPLLAVLGSILAYANYEKKIK